MTNNIELELRAEVSLNHFEELITQLNQKSKIVSQTKRLSAMFLGKINKSNFDMRVRIDSNGKSEFVVKKGDFHVHNRIEISQEISKSQFIGMVKILSLLKFRSKITERENFIYNLGNNIELVLVKAGSIAYIEIEKMSNVKNIKDNKLELLSIIKSLNLKLIKNDKEFNKLCNRLTKHSDWIFNGSKAHIEKLESLLASY